MRLSFNDDLRFDPSARQLWRGDREVHLTRKAFDLLALLVERRPDAVSKQEIHASLWPDTFVSEATLQSLVFEVREAVGDEARKPRVIRTVHGFGYAFCAPAREAAEPAAPERPIRGWLLGELGRIPLYAGENVIGREEGVLEAVSPVISRRHARITLGDRVWLEDLGSKNGTFVDDQPVAGRVSLEDGDRFRLGSVLMTFRLVPADQNSTETAGVEGPPFRRD